MSSTKAKILVAVTNDISTDQRVHKVASYLVDKGFDVLVYGRVLPTTFEVNRTYKIIRKKHWFNINFLFYAEYNIRLLFFLLRTRSTYILSNDLDTLPACFLASRLKRVNLVYDSHELFTETPELQGRKAVQKFWKFIERLILPKIDKSYTVSKTIATEYFKRYGIQMGVIRNVPYLENEYVQEDIEFPTVHKVLLYQGILSENRGLKQTILALRYLKEVDLVIIGYGKEKDTLVQFVKKEEMESRVHFLGRIPFEKLHNYTKKANIGILLEEPNGMSFEYALPNKLFDYIHSELPILAYPLLEIKKIMSDHNIGILVENHDPKQLAIKINELLYDEELRTQIKKNQQKLKTSYAWEVERKKLDVYFKKNL